MKVAGMIVLVIAAAIGGVFAGMMIDMGQTERSLKSLRKEDEDVNRIGQAIWDRIFKAATRGIA